MIPITKQFNSSYYILNVKEKISKYINLIRRFLKKNKKVYLY